MRHDRLPENNTMNISKKKKHWESRNKIVESAVSLRRGSRGQNLDNTEE
jgi:hypothetical protein